jgi:ureidoglycolate lyase
MTARTLHLEPVTRDAFAPFGQLIEAAGAAKDANQGTAARFDFAAQLANLRPHARPNVAVFRAQPRPLPLEIRLLEKHPGSSQMFVPMTAPRYAVLVAHARPDGAPDLDSLRAFACASHQAINYNAGTWHHPMIALDAPSDFVMLAWEDGTPGDCVEHPLSEAWTLAE